MHYVKLICSFLCALTFSHMALGVELKGNIVIDGSSTLSALTEAVAEEFQKTHPHVRVTVGTSGTGGGFNKFIAKETDINDASRLIKDKEVEKANASKLDYIHLAVAIDGISVVVNKNNKLSSISTEQLKKIWEPSSKVAHWNDVDAAWPKTKMKLYGPGPASGTFDYFTEDVVGTARSSRADYTASERDNDLVHGVSQDPNALGYFGFTYYIQNKNKLKALAVSKGKDAVEPTEASIADGTYPLSRLLYLYISKASAERSEVSAFVDFYMTHAAKLAKQENFVSLPDARYKEELAKWNNWRGGTAKSAAKEQTQKKK